VKLQPDTHVCLVVVFCLQCLPGALSAEARGKGLASVTLVVPYRTVLVDELVRFTVRLQNGSNDKLPFVADSFDAAGRQVFIKVLRGVPDFDETFRTDSRPGFGRPAIHTIERDGNWDAVAKVTTGSLPPGDSVEWDGSKFDPRLFWITLGRPKSIQAQVLIGPGRWVSSEPVRISAVDVQLSTFPIVFEDFFLLGPKKSKVPKIVRRVSLDGKHYLFSNSCDRICEIPDGGTPRFTWERESRILTVRFEGVKAAPVRYDCRFMRVVP